MPTSSMKGLEPPSQEDLKASPVAVKIASALDDPDLVFVFPTQIAADSWAKASLDFSGRTCINLDRFLGWDSFLGSLRQIPDSLELREADTRSRLLWACSLLEGKEKKPNLKRLVNPDRTPPKSMAWSLAAAAPFLQDAAACIREKINDGSLPQDDALIRDYEFLWADYASFLRKHGIYEPASLPLRSEAGGRFLLFYPSLMPGYSPELFACSAALSIEIWAPEELKSTTAAEIIKTQSPPEGIQASPLTQGSPAVPAVRAFQPPLLLSFASLRDELEYVFGVCRRWLDQGVPASELALSLPSLGADIIAHVSRIARSWGLPLQFRSGRALSDSPIGKLLSASMQALSEGFSRRSLETLFDPSLAEWKEATSCLALLDLARRYHIPELSSDPEYMRILWAKTLRLAPEQAESAIPFFTTLRSSCAAISGSRSFSSLRIALHAFIDDLLVERNFSDYANRTLQRIFEELSSLETWEARLTDSLPAFSPIELLLAVLEHSHYTPDESLEAISVYPYHLGILSAARLHFILEASMESAIPAIRLLSRAPQEIGARQDEAALTQALFDSMRMVNGVFCHAENSLEGYSVAHPYFFRRSAQRITIQPAEIPPSPEILETKAWQNLDVISLPTRLPALALEAAQGSFSGPTTRFQTLPPPIFFDAEGCLRQKPEPRPALDPASLLRLRAFNAAPLFKLNPRGLGYISLCPFRWFLSGIPGMEEEIADPAILAEGMLMHDMIRRLLAEPQSATELGEKASPTLPGQAGLSLDDRIQNAFQSALKKTLNRSGHSLQIALESAYPKIRDRIGRILAYENTLSEESWLKSDFERVLWMELPELGLRLEGRADRVVFRPAPNGSRIPSSQAGEEAAFASSFQATGGVLVKPLSTRPECLLLDYKRKRCPAKKEFLADEEGKVQDFQINAYAAMLESSGFTVLQALYWSIEDNKPVVVFGSGKQRPDRASFEPERRALHNALAEASERIHNGRFLEIKPSAQACLDCAFRAVCRIHFSAERS